MRINDIKNAVAPSFPIMKSEHFSICGQRKILLTSQKALVDELTFLKFLEYHL